MMKSTPGQVRALVQARDHQDINPVNEDLLDQLRTKGLIRWAGPESDVEWVITEVGKRFLEELEK